MRMAVHPFIAVGRNQGIGGPRTGAGDWVERGEPPPRASRRASGERVAPSRTRRMQEPQWAEPIEPGRRRGSRASCEHGVGLIDALQIEMFHPRRQRMLSGTAERSPVYCRSARAVIRA